MNQTPQRPGNEPEPLDAAEREIARMLRNLPSGSPPPELDARILAAARRAVQQPRARQVNWWRSVGFGTAASALIAMGLFVKMHGADQGVPPAPEAAANAAADADRAQSTPAAEGAPKPVSPSMNAPPMAPVMPPPQPPPPPEHYAPAPAPIVTDTEVVADKPAANAFPAPQKTQNLAAPPPVAQASEIAREAAPAPAAPATPAPPPADERAESKAEGYTARRDAMGAAAAASVEQGKLDKDVQPATTMAASGAVATGGAASANGQPALQAGVEEQDAKKSKSLDSITVTRSRTRHADTKPASATTIPLDDDALLAPAQWIERIRDRMHAGDQAHARESLQRFRVRYPDAAVPSDLQPLLQ